MNGAELDSCVAALHLLLHGLAPEQRPHASEFLLTELERLYVASGCTVPEWVNIVRMRERKRSEGVRLANG